PGRGLLWETPPHEEPLRATLERGAKDLDLLAEYRRERRRDHGSGVVARRVLHLRRDRVQRAELYRRRQDRAAPVADDPARRGDGLRGDHANRRGADKAEPLRVRLDPRRRVQAGALDDQKGVLTAELVALRREALRLVARGGDRGRLSEIEKGQEKAHHDHPARYEERADLPARAPNTRGLARGRRPAMSDGLPMGTVLHAPRLRRARCLCERQGRRSAARRAALRARGLRSTSAEAARSGRRVRARKPARCPQTQVGRWGGQMQSRDSRAKNCLTMRSSSEWNEITTIRPPGRTTRM